MVQMWGLYISGNPYCGVLDYEVEGDNVSDTHNTSIFRMQEWGGTWKAGNCKNVQSHRLEGGSFKESVTDTSSTNDKTLVRYDILTAVLLQLPCLLGCDAVWLGGYFLTFHRKSVPSSAGSAAQDYYYYYYMLHGTLFLFGIIKETKTSVGCKWHWLRFEYDVLSEWYSLQHNATGTECPL